ncbi:DUF1178 family protein [Paroceanicella profunda]|uniref:DUF1178 family protein n=1 Tax=Paroceanicella profunda TaxID=2579971 RepID=A0A5B8G458_9RHOB|nr:DUF1178 family protein [Paroceanicella profunda]QDL93663.1 DUF1178 family protein [Paroceanicella profunda]
MIRYALRCADGHVFDSWFQSSDAYETLRKAGHLSCAVCASGKVEKSVMAPRVSTHEVSPAPERPLSAPASPAEQMIAELRRRIESSADNVGRDFASEARRIHEGEAPRRAIYGEASGEEARALIEDDIPIAPLPWNTRKTS